MRDIIIEVVKVIVVLAVIAGIVVVAWDMSKEGQSPSRIDKLEKQVEQLSQKLDAHTASK